MLKVSKVSQYTKELLLKVLKKRTYTSCSKLTKALQYLFLFELSWVFWL